MEQKKHLGRGVFHAPMELRLRSIAGSAVDLTQIMFVEGEDEGFAKLIWLIMKKVIANDYYDDGLPAIRLFESICCIGVDELSYNIFDDANKKLALVLINCGLAKVVPCDEGHLECLQNFAEGPVEVIRLPSQVLRKSVLRSFVGARKNRIEGGEFVEGEANAGHIQALKDAFHILESEQWQWTRCCKTHYKDYVFRVWEAALPYDAIIRERADAYVRALYEQGNQDDVTNNRLTIERTLEIFKRIFGPIHDLTTKMTLLNLQSTLQSQDVSYEAKLDLWGITYPWFSGLSGIFAVGAELLSRHYFRRFRQLADMMFEIGITLQTELNGAQVEEDDGNILRIRTQFLQSSLEGHTFLLQNLLNIKPDYSNIPVLSFTCVVKTQLALERWEEATSTLQQMEIVLKKIMTRDSTTLTSLSFVFREYKALLKIDCPDKKGKRIIFEDAQNYSRSRPEYPIFFQLSKIFKHLFSFVNFSINFRPSIWPSEALLTISKYFLLSLWKIEKYEQMSLAIHQTNGFWERMVEYEIGTLSRESGSSSDEVIPFSDKLKLFMAFHKLVYQIGRAPSSKRTISTQRIKKKLVEDSLGTCLGLVERIHHRYRFIIDQNLDESRLYNSLPEHIIKCYIFLGQDSEAILYTRNYTRRTFHKFNHQGRYFFMAQLLLSFLNTGLTTLNERKAEAIGVSIFLPEIERQAGIIEEEVTPFIQDYIQKRLVRAQLQELLQSCITYLPISILKRPYELMS